MKNAMDSTQKVNSKDEEEKEDGYEEVNFFIGYVQ